MLKCVAQEVGDKNASRATKHDKRKNVAMILYFFFSVKNEENQPRTLPAGFWLRRSRSR